MWISGERSRGPASIRQTLRAGSALRRLASTQPAEPAPTITVSNCTPDTLPPAAPNATPQPSFSLRGRLWLNRLECGHECATVGAPAASNEFLRSDPAHWCRIDLSAIHRTGESGSGSTETIEPPAAAHCRYPRAAMTVSGNIPASRHSSRPMRATAITNSTSRRPANGRRIAFRRRRIDRSSPEMPAPSSLPDVPRMAAN